MTGSIVRASGSPDWFLIPWGYVWERLKLAPTDVPGVQELKGGGSKRAPFLYEVHRTHLAMFGLEVPRGMQPQWAHGWSEHERNPLRPYQVETAKFIRSRRGTLLASEQRTGKTPSIMYAYEPEAGPMLVVGPVAARVVWHEWAARRFGNCAQFFQQQDKLVREREYCPVCSRVISNQDPFQERPSFLALEGRTYRPEMVAKYRPRIMFITFAVASTWRELAVSLLGSAGIARLGMLVIDEAHLAGMQNRKSLTVESIRWLNSIAHRVVLATGTPLFNKVKGLWPLLDICAPTAFGDFWDFARRYCAARPTEHGWRADGTSNERELKQRLEEIMFRRRWTDIKSDLPPITRSIETVALSHEQRDEIEELAARLRFETGGAKTAVGILSRLRRLFAEAKLSAGVKAVIAELAEGHSVIAWTWHTDIAARLAEQLQRKGVSVSGPITGKVTGHERETILETARNAAVSAPHVLVANIAALGTAVNLSWASHEVFVELDWNPPNIAQAEMRPYDGENPISALYLVADCDSDENLVEALIAKLGAQDSLGLRAGVGDVADVLQRTFKIEGQTLNQLASRLIDNAEGEV